MLRSPPYDFVHGAGATPMRERVPSLDGAGAGARRADALGAKASRGRRRLCCGAGEKRGLCVAGPRQIESIFVLALIKCI
jgi:hypothetical protein